ncbi:Extracellular serine-rich protein [Ceratocystis lukuohia]|uniref:Extracellular serine-rich protein n=1 Tax=Ceratocystis lukuohia TaxID=2019550 RepID=A0ABR4MMA6_9PEZI
MRFPLATLLAATTVLAAPSSTVETGPSPGSHAPAATHSVLISKNEIYPPNTVAKVGDSINFIFVGGTDMVAQSSYDAPCVQLEGGFYFGSYFIEGPKHHSILLEVMNNDPIWLFNGAEDYCRNGGVVGAINSPETPQMNVADFKKAAMAK